MRPTLVVNKRLHDFDVDITRAGKFGNPFTHLSLTETTALVQVLSLREALDLYERWLKGYIILRGRLAPSVNEVRALAGRRLGCVCVKEPVDAFGRIYPEGLMGRIACHGQILARYADRLVEDDPAR